LGLRCRTTQPINLLAEVNAIIKIAWIDEAGDAKKAKGMDLFSINSAIMK